MSVALQIIGALIFGVGTLLQMVMAQITGHQKRKISPTLWDLIGGAWEDRKARKRREVLGLWIASIGLFIGLIGLLYHD